VHHNRLCTRHPRLDQLREHRSVSRLKCSASSVSQVGGLRSEDLYFGSFYLDKAGQKRGMCNWVLPGKIMVGRYPHGTPIGSKTGRPSAEESLRHLREVSEAGVNTFLMLQEEVPSQDDDSAWPVDDLIPLADPQMAARYPMGFSRYYKDALQVAGQLGRPSPVFMHLPIRDFSVPNMADLMGGHPEVSLAPRS